MTDAQGVLLAAWVTMFVVGYVTFRLSFEWDNGSVWGAVVGFLVMWIAAFLLIDTLVGGFVA